MEPAADMERGFIELEIVLLSFSLLLAVSVGCTLEHIGMKDRLYSTGMETWS